MYPGQSKKWRCALVTVKTTAPNPWKQTRGLILNRASMFLGYLAALTHLCKHPIQGALANSVNPDHNGTRFPLNIGISGNNKKLTRHSFYCCDLSIENWPVQELSSLNLGNFLIMYDVGQTCCHVHCKMIVCIVCVIYRNFYKIW